MRQPARRIRARVSVFKTVKYFLRDQSGWSAGSIEIECAFAGDIGAGCDEARLAFKLSCFDVDIGRGECGGRVQTECTIGIRMAMGRFFLLGHRAVFIHHHHDNGAVGLTDFHGEGRTGDEFACGGNSGQNECRDKKRV